MRRQEAFDGTAAEANRDQRLDPFALPVTYAVPMAGRPPGVATSATIDRNLAILTRPSESLTLPVKAFRGVAVRMEMVGPTGELSVVLELNHADPSLSLPLIVAGDPAEVAADWQAWSRCLGLPMLLIEQDGSITRPIKTLGAIVPGSPKPRRMYSFFAGRRPRFLARRKTGWVRGAEILRTDEIIARN